MADQIISDEGDSGSKPNVALKLWNILRHELEEKDDAKANINQQLDLFATCLQAANYGRKPNL